MREVRLRSLLAALLIVSGPSLLAQGQEPPVAPEVQETPEPEVAQQEPTAPVESTEEEVSGCGAVQLMEASTERAGQVPTFVPPYAIQAVPGEFLITFRDRPAMLQAANVLAEQEDVEVLGALSLINVQLIRLDPAAEIRTLSAALAAAPGTEIVEPNYCMYAVIEPNDPQYDEQWAWPIINAPTAWDVVREGPDVVVAVIDTGVDYEHEDLADNMWENDAEIPGNNVDDDQNGIVDDLYGANFVPVQADGDPMDDNSHGTHVAGTVGAVTDNETGVAGTTWDVQIMALKFLDAEGSGSVFNAIRAMEYAIVNGAHIMSNSWGSYGVSQALEEAIEVARDNGVLFIAAACNDSLNNDVTPCFPASYDTENVISVMASDQADGPAGFSNYGSNSVDIAAPGVTILSSLPGDDYQSFNGTSMATPHVSGAAALLKAQDASRQATQLKQLILETAEGIPALAGLSVTGGRLDLAAALSPVQPPLPPPIAAGACSLCWTCGGAWPTYDGTIPTRIGAVERGPSCQGSPASSSDTIPYLCCRNQ